MNLINCLGSLFSSLVVSMSTSKLLPPFCPPKANLQSSHASKTSSRSCFVLDPSSFSITILQGSSSLPPMKILTLESSYSSPLKNSRVYAPITYLNAPSENCKGKLKAVASLLKISALKSSCEGSESSARRSATEMFCSLLALNGCIYL